MINMSGLSAIRNQQQQQNNGRKVLNDNSGTILTNEMNRVKTLSYSNQDQIPKVNNSNKNTYSSSSVLHNNTSESDIYSSYLQKDDDSTTYLDVILKKLDSREKQMILEVSLV